MSEGDVPEGSVAVGRRVPLPAGAGPPFTVFVNGVTQTEGSADLDTRRVSWPNPFRCPTVRVVAPVNASRRSTHLS